MVETTLHASRQSVFSGTNHPQMLSAGRGSGGWETTLVPTLADKSMDQCRFGAVNTRASGCKGVSLSYMTLCTAVEEAPHFNAWTVLRAHYSNR